MAFAMALVHEENKKYSHAAKFLKRLFFCSKLLDDFEGSEIALNKIGMCYFNMGNYDLSLSFHKKHYEVNSKKRTENKES